VVQLQTGRTSQPDQIWPEILYLDPLGNTISVLVLAMMVLSLIAVAATITSTLESAKQRVGIAFPVVAVAGALISAYLLYDQMNGADPASAPLGNCEAVLRSPFAMVFETMPTSALSLAGHLMITGLWFVGRRSVARKANITILCLFGIVVAAVVLTIYLLSVQLLSVGVSCVWCLVSAILVTALLWILAPKITSAWNRISPALPWSLDSKTAEAIRQRLRSRILPSYIDVVVTARRRRVTLRGAASAACFSKLAEQIATTVDGVRAVENEIEIAPSENTLLERCGRVSRNTFPLHQSAGELRPVGSH